MKCLREKNRAARCTRANGGNEAKGKELGSNISSKGLVIDDGDDAGAGDAAEASFVLHMYGLTRDDQNGNNQAHVLHILPLVAESKPQLEHRYSLNEEMPRCFSQRLPLQ